MSAEKLNIYSINFIARNDQSNEIVERWLFTQPDIEDFVAPIPLNFFVKTNLSATSLTFSIDFMFPGGIYVVARIDPSDLNGKLTGDLWEWFYEDNTQFGKKAGVSKISQLKLNLGQSALGKT